MMARTESMLLASTSDASGAITVFPSSCGLAYVDYMSYAVRGYVCNDSLYNACKSRFAWVGCLIAP